jgi:hypothetical protein
MAAMVVTTALDLSACVCAPALVPSCGAYGFALAMACSQVMVWYACHGIPFSAPLLAMQALLKQTSVICISPRVHGLGQLIVHVVGWLLLDSEFGWTTSLQGFVELCVWR